MAARDKREWVKKCCFCGKDAPPKLKGWMSARMCPSCTGKLLNYEATGFRYTWREQVMETVKLIFYLRQHYGRPSLPDIAWALKKMKIPPRRGEVWSVKSPYVNQLGRLVDEIERIDGVFLNEKYKKVELIEIVLGRNKENVLRAIGYPAERHNRGKNDVECWTYRSICHDPNVKGAYRNADIWFNSNGVVDSVRLVPSGVRRKGKDRNP